MKVSTKICTWLLNFKFPVLSFLFFSPSFLFVLQKIYCKNKIITSNSSQQRAPNCSLHKPGFCPAAVIQWVSRES